MGELQASRGWGPFGAGVEPKDRLPDYKSFSGQNGKRVRFAPGEKDRLRGRHVAAAIDMEAAFLPGCYGVPRRDLLIPFNQQMVSLNAATQGKDDPFLQGPLPVDQIAAI
jgi:hypothetical protein